MLPDDPERRYYWWFFLKLDLVIVALLALCGGSIRVFSEPPVGPPKSPLKRGTSCSCSHD